MSTILIVAHQTGKYPNCFQQAWRRARFKSWLIRPEIPNYFMK
jgi:hypothetical protein